MTHDELWGVGTYEDAEVAFAQGLARAHVAAPDDGAPFRSALLALVTVWDRTAGGPGWAGPRYCAALADFAPHVSAYLHNALTVAEGARDANELFELATRRTALQLLLDGCRGAPAVSMIDAAELRELDDQLRELVAEHGPLPQPCAPRQLPQHHWWWGGDRPVD